MAVEVREGAKVTAYGLYIDGEYRQDKPSGECGAFGPQIKEQQEQYWADDKNGACNSKGDFQPLTARPWWLCGSLGQP